MKPQTLKRIIDVMEAREEKFTIMKVPRPEGEIGAKIETEVGTCDVINKDESWVFITASLDQLRELSAKNL